MSGATGSPNGAWRRLLPPPGTSLVRHRDHLATYGPLPAEGGTQGGGGLIEAVTASGLSGRGGAGFPTGQKLAVVAARPGAKCVLVNAAETEPLAVKDRTLCRRVPHLVIDGAEAAAAAVGAGEVEVLAHEAALRALSFAVDQRRHLSSLRWRVTAAPGRFTSGEETALVSLANGGDGLPKTKPPRPFERGVRGHPTLVLNAETAANVALIARSGPGWLRATGSEEEPGNLLFSISGAVERPGLYEAPTGSRVGELLALAGSPQAAEHPVLVGGYFGAFLPPNSGDVAFSRRGLAPHGAGTGAGVVFALGADRCGLVEATHIVDYLARQSAGQCGPCVFGLRAVADELAALNAGRPGASRARLERWGAQIRGRGACAHPDGAVRLVASALRVFSDEVDRHAEGSCCAHLPATMAVG